MNDETAEKTIKVDESLQNQAKTLSAKDRRFAEEYVAGGLNPGKAAKAAG